MSEIKELKDRILSISETHKITNAMYLIASTKMKRAKVLYERAKPHFKATENEIKNIFRIIGKIDSPYYRKSEETAVKKNCACLVITADRGLAGRYNQNVIKTAQEITEKYENTKLFVVGNYGRRYYYDRGTDVERYFLYTAKNPTAVTAREIASVLLDGYDKKEFDDIFLVYTDFLSSVKSTAKVVRVLPFTNEISDEESDGKNTENKNFEFYPSAEKVLQNMVPSYLSGLVYGALIDSFCSEQGARMTAMDSANKNAQEIITELIFRYNSQRQANITREISEISAAAKAKREKEEVNL